MHDVAGAPGGGLVASEGRAGGSEDPEGTLWEADRATRLAAARAALRAIERTHRDPTARRPQAARETPPSYPAALDPVTPQPVPWGLRHEAGAVPDPVAAERAAPVSDVAPLRTLEFAVVDVETTGGSGAFGHRVTEVGIVCLTGAGAFRGEFRSLVNPHRPIPASITRLTRITQAMADAAPSFTQIAERVQAILRGRVLVAHNAGFDWRFLQGEFALCGRRVPTRARLCTVRLARRLVPEVRSRSLDSLSRYFGIPNEARHRAWGDARATAALLVRLVERAEERAAPTLTDVRTLLKPLAPRSRRRSALPRSMDWA